MSIKKLVVVEFEVGDGNPPTLADVGFKYSYFQDPLTGKYYRPKSTYEVTGDDLETLFEELIPRK
jgi:hypothetical protein